MKRLRLLKNLSQINDRKIRSVYMHFLLTTALCLFHLMTLYDHVWSPIIT